MAEKDQVYLDSEAKINLNKIIAADLERNGMDADDVAMLSPTGLMIAGFNTIFDSVSNIMNTIKRESSLTTAQYSSSLYNQLVQYESEITLSQPSRLKMFVKIPVDQIKVKGKLVQANTYEFQYTNDNIVQLDGKNFRPDIDVHYIRYTDTKAKYDVRVFYRDTDGLPVNIPTQTMWDTGVRYLVFSAEFVQLEVETVERTFSDSQLDMFIVSSTNPIYDFELFYKDNQADEYVAVDKRMFYTRGQGSFMQYKILANNKLRLDHKYVIGGFQPSVGGILKIVMYTTTGENVKYRGAAIALKSKPIDLKVEYYSIGGEAFESTGGRLSSNDKEVLRNYIIKLKGSRRRIDTEADMGVWLKAYGGASEFKPQLNINDPLMRLFNIFTVLSFSHTIGIEERVFTVPTNSGTISVGLDRLPYRMLNGFKWYTINPTMAIKSIQTNRNQNFSYDASVDTSTFVPPESESTFYYVSPFILSYNEEENFCRSFMDAQYKVYYESKVEFESTSDKIPSRFISTAMRMEDYVDTSTNQRIFQIVSQIRADAPEYIIDDTNFRAELILTKPDETTVTLTGTPIMVDEEDNKYDITFPLTCNRVVYNTHCFLQINGEEVELDVSQNAKMNLYSKVLKQGSESEYEEILVSTFSADIKIFQEVTPSVNIQTNMNYNGNMDFQLVPLVSLEFYQKPQNKQKIIEEINNIFDFIKSEIYTEYDMYASKGVTLEDVQETLFNVSIKFAKTYGRSKFLNVGADKSTAILNLQLKPTLYIRKLDEEFDESAISSQLNKTLISYDYDMMDLHMSDLVKEVLSEATDSVSILQFVNFDNYPPNYHMIERNDTEEKNFDPPEVVSLQPIWSDEADAYKYNITYVEI